MPSRCAPDNCFAVDRVGDHRNWIPDFMSSSFSRARSSSCKLFARRVFLHRRISLTSLNRSSAPGQRVGLLPDWDWSDESGIRVRVVLPATVLSGDGRDDSLLSRQKLGPEDIVSGSQ
jgi:hypothetical protein